MSDSCDRMDDSPPGSSVHGIFQARILESGLLFPFPGDLPNPGIEPSSPASPALAGKFFTTEPPGKPKFLLASSISCLSGVSHQHTWGVPMRSERIRVWAEPGDPSLDQSAGPPASASSSSEQLSRLLSPWTCPSGRAKGHSGPVQRAFYPDPKAPG